MEGAATDDPWDFKLMDRMERARAARRLWLIVRDGTIDPGSEEEYQAWKAEYEKRRAAAAEAWWCRQCCGEHEQRYMSGWCPLAGFGCWSTAAGMEMALLVWKDPKTEGEQDVPDDG